MKEINEKAELNFENKQNASDSFNIIKKEYLYKNFRRFFYLLTILALIVLYFTKIYPQYLSSDTGIGITGLNTLAFPSTMNWVLVSISVYLIFYIINISLLRFTPSLKKYIHQEIHNLGFTIQKSFRSVVIFILLNSSSFSLSLLREAKIIQFNNSILNSGFKWLVLTFLILAIVIPILWSLFYDRLIIKIKNNYQIFINLYYKIRKRRNEKYNLIAIYLTSNRLALKINEEKRKLYSLISSDRWLLRKKRSLLSWFNLSPFLRFQEFSTPLNFQKKLLNIALALYDWDLNQEKIKA